VAQAQLPPHEQLTPSPPQSAPDLDEAVDVAQVHTALHALVQRLPAQLRQVMVAYYGLDGSPPSSLRQLAQAWGLSHETVRQRLLAALVWLRHPLYSLGLRQLLERNTVQDYEETLALTRRYPTRRATLWYRISFNGDHQ
jgi:DNA-directed RNA polymerase specialized sigma24 family protein